MEKVVIVFKCLRNQQLTNFPVMYKQLVCNPGHLQNEFICIYALWRSCVLEYIYMHICKIISIFPTFHKVFPFCFVEILRKSMYSLLRCLRFFFYFFNKMSELLPCTRQKLTVVSKSLGHFGWTTFLQGDWLCFLLLRSFLGQLFSPQCHPPLTILSDILFSSVNTHIWTRKSAVVFHKIWGFAGMKHQSNQNWIIRILLMKSLSPFPEHFSMVGLGCWPCAELLFWLPFFRLLPDFLASFSQALCFPYCGFHVISLLFISSLCHIDW